LDQLVHARKVQTRYGQQFKDVATEILTIVGKKEDILRLLNQFVLSKELTGYLIM
jgi:hypothetical protein